VWNYLWIGTILQRSYMGELQERILLAEAYAKQNKIKTTIIRPVYPSKREYYLHRNAEMIGMCDEVVAFLGW